ncbi:PTS glucose transporter subunit IIA [Lactiplantibacillus carotarum]|uniref:PTS glucose transporter subunit IIA n=1 Tax=Lactiplantibacillus carotarum TaxID=2993456 RepID=UPI00298F0F66|nr:PTS glucose transporter subunit IIA [Lactiplantibacillus carotarum]
MGLFSFGKKVKLYAPVDGTLTDLADGTTGFAVRPERHHIYSPVDGTVSELLPEQGTMTLTNGKVTIRLQMGSTAGSGAATYVHEGDAVTPETPIAFMDQDDLEEAGKDATVTVTVDNAATAGKAVKLSTSGQVSHDQEVATVVAK